MADIRPIPYSVGQYEAQVFDLSGMARVMAQQEAARRKTQAEAKKEADKTLSEMSTTMAKGRNQDLPYLNELYKSVQNFSFQNASKLQPGTSEYNKYNELKGKFYFEAQRSMNEKESDKVVANWMAVNADKQKIGQGSLDYWKEKQKPINDQSRANYKFKKSDGTEVAVDQVNLPDLEKYDAYDENTTRKDIEAIKGQQVSTVDFVRNYKGVDVPFGTMKETTIEFKLPSKVLQTFDSNYTRSRDAEDFYTKEWNKLSQSQKDDMNKAFQELPSILSAAGIKEQVKLDMKDGVAGISNPYEYGAAKFLLQNLPDVVKEDIDLSLASMYQTQAYRSRSLALRNSLKVKENIDTGLAKSLTDAGFNLKSYVNAYNNMIGVSGAGTGTAYVPAAVKSVDTKNKILRLETRYPVVSDDGAVKDFSTASSITGLGGFQKGKNEWLVKDKKGNYVRVKSTMYNLNPNTVGYETNILNMNNAVEEAIKLSGNEESYRNFKGLRTTGSQMTDVGGEVEGIMINP
jgi:hypothetical protein